jgi:hypothetical protein
MKVDHTPSSTSARAAVVWVGPRQGRTRSGNRRQFRGNGYRDLVARLHLRSFRGLRVHLERRFGRVVAEGDRDRSAELRIRCVHRECHCGSRQVLSPVERTRGDRAEDDSRLRDTRARTAGSSAPRERSPRAGTGTPRTTSAAPNTPGENDKPSSRHSHGRRVITRTCGSAICSRARRTFLVEPNE